MSWIRAPGPLWAGKGDTARKGPRTSVARLMSSSVFPSTSEGEPARRDQHPRHDCLEVGLVRLPLDRDRAQWFVESLQVEHPDVGEGVGAAPARHDLHDIGAQDLTGLSRDFQPLRLDHRQAEAVVAFEGDVATRQADPHLEWLGAGPSVVVGDRLLHRDGAGDGVGGTRERRHHAVAEMLDDQTPVRLDRRPDELVMSAAKLVCTHLAQP